MKWSWLVVAVGCIGAAAWGEQARAQALIDEFAVSTRPPDVDVSTGLEGRAGLDLEEIQSVWNQVCEEQRIFRVSPAIKRWPYSPHETLCIEARRLAKTTIVFPESERIISFDVGDSSAVAVSTGCEESAANCLRNVLYIQPQANVGVDTLVHAAGVLSEGQRNYYSFYVRTHDIDHDDFPDGTVFVEAEVGDPVAAVAKAESKRARLDGAFDEVYKRTGRIDGMGEDWLRFVPFDASAMRSDEWSVCPADEESRSIEPVAVWSDDHFIFLDYGENADAIARAAIDRVVDDVGNPANWSVTGPHDNLVVVEHARTDLTLTNGERIVCLKYKSPC